MDTHHFSPVREAFFNTLIKDVHRGQKNSIIGTSTTYALVNENHLDRIRLNKNAELGDMSNLNKFDFTALEVYGKNYLKSDQDVKLHPTAKNLRPAIEDKMNNPVGKAKKTTAMIFIRRHIHDALQTEYLAEEDPQALWVALADRFVHQKDIFLHEARHDWQHLCFQDFKSANEYNSKVCRI